MEITKATTFSIDGKFIAFVHNDNVISISEPKNICEVRSIFNKNKNDEALKLKGH